METWKYKGHEFLIVRFSIEHYTNVNVYHLGKYTPFFGDERTAKYLQSHPNTRILILEEAEADHFFRQPILNELWKYQAKYFFHNKVLIFFQGTGQENFINEYLRTRVPPQYTFVQAHTAPYNLIHNWVKSYSEKHFTYEELKDRFVPDYSFKNIKLKKRFLVFAGKPRIPRLMVLDRLVNHNLLDDCYYNFGTEYVKRFKEFMDDKLVDQVMEEYGHKEYKGRLEADFIPSRGPLLSKEEEDRLREVHKLTPLKDIPNDTDEDYYYTPNFIIPDPDLYKSIFLDFVLETFNHRGTYSDGLMSNINFFTEKIFKGPLTCRPFIVLGNRYYLRDLKEKFGFKSFNDYWDESYDEKEDVRDALDVIFKNLLYLKSLSFVELKEMLEDMKDILIHNNKVARKFLEGPEPWKQVMKDFVDGRSKTWTGKRGGIPI